MSNHFRGTLDSIDLAQYDLYRQGFPHDIFRFLRNEAPVWWHPGTPGVKDLGIDGFWVISSHEDIVNISKDYELYRSFEGPRVAGWPESARGQMLITMDPPAHSRVRKLISAGFTPRMVASLDEQSRKWAARIVDEALEKGTVNFVDAVAYRLPMNMIADIVGIPESDREALFDLVNRILFAQDPAHPLPQEEQARLQGEIFMYGRGLSDSKLKNPTDDVWSQLTQAEITLDDGTTTKLSQIELDLFFMVLTLAGSETTRNSITQGLQELVNHPDQIELMRTDPSLVNSACEEMIRWTSAVTYFRRTATRDHEFKGHQVKEGDPVTLWYPSGNFDETVFNDPYRYDVTRSPNPHVGFGGPGPHHCLGASLARREMKVMFEELLKRVEGFEVLGPPEMTVLGIKSPVIFSPVDLQVRLIPKKG